MVCVRGGDAGPCCGRGLRVRASLPVIARLRTFLRILRLLTHIPPSAHVGACTSVCSDAQCPCSARVPQDVKVNFLDNAAFEGLVDFNQYFVGALGWVLPQYLKGWVSLPLPESSPRRTDRVSPVPNLMIFS